MKKATPSPGATQTILFAQSIPNGSGGFTVIPQKPVQEVTSREAARILGVAHSSMSNIVNMPKAQKILVWRWTSESCGKRLFTLESVIRYREALKEIEGHQ